MSCLVRVVGAPASELLPNAQRRLHHMRRAATIKEIRERTAWTAKGEHCGSCISGAAFSGPVRISAVIAWPKGRQVCDFQSAVHALKGAVDGLQDGYVIEDDRLVIGMEIEQIAADPGDAAGWFSLEVSAA